MEHVRNRSFIVPGVISSIIFIIIYYFVINDGGVSAGLGIDDISDHKKEVDGYSIKDGVVQSGDPESNNTVEEKYLFQQNIGVNGSRTARATNSAPVKVVTPVEK